VTELELIVRGGRVVTPERIVRADLGIAHGKFVRMAPTIDDPAAEEISAEGRYIFPGMIDPAMHCAEPGRDDREGLAYGSAAWATGGGTVFFDLPSPGDPPVLDAAALRAKRTLAEEKSAVDFALWGALTPRNLDRLAALRDAGAIGFYAVMAGGGGEGLPWADERTLREGMKRAAKLGLPVAVRAEDEEAVAQATAEQRRSGRVDAAAWRAGRPPAAELAAIRLATEIAGEMRCALHLAAVSCPEAVALVEEAREQGVDVTVQTCPHYLLWSDLDVARLGLAAKAAPPIRDEVRRRALWEELRAGRIDTLGSDHLPAPPEDKAGTDFFAGPTGVAGVQHGAQLVLGEAEERDLPRLAALLARNAARRFRLGARKGAIEEGKDADFCLFEFVPPRPIEADELWTRHRTSGYVGLPNRVRVTDTFVRGQAVYRNGRHTNFGPKPEFLRPEK
jgi:allantoinase